LIAAKEPAISSQVGTRKGRTHLAIRASCPRPVEPTKKFTYGT
jgi:hypothetical protein